MIMNGCTLVSRGRENGARRGRDEGRADDGRGRREASRALARRGNVALQFIVSGPEVPAEREILHWAGMALQDRQGEVTIRVIGEDEMQALNRRWRGADRPTNVLAFPLHDAGCPMLGDVVICAPVVKREAAQQGKSPHAHWAHIIIHGILHLLGYDHTGTRDAPAMEGKETRLLRELGFPDPYFSENTTSAGEPD